MRLKMRVKKVRELKNASRFESVEPDGKYRPMKDFYVNTELLSSLPFDTDELTVHISDGPFAEGEVALAFPQVPFFRSSRNTVRYQHTAERKANSRRRPRPAPSTPELPVTLAYVNRDVLEAEFIAARKPICFGISPVTEYENRAASSGTEVGGAGIFTTFDAFLRESVRKRRGRRLTSRQILAVWRTRCGADPDAEVVQGIRLTDVARRFRAVFGVTATGPTRIDGRLQRYWDDYTI